MRQTVSLCLSIMKSISVWRWNTISSVSTALLCKSGSDHQRISFFIMINWVLWFSDQPWKNQLTWASSMWHIQGIFKKGLIQSQAKFIFRMCLEKFVQQCQVFRNVKGGPLGGGTWPALNHNDIYAPQPLKLSKYSSPCHLMENVSPVQQDISYLHEWR